jgi:hypothetical protein
VDYQTNASYDNSMCPFVDAGTPGSGEEFMAYGIEVSASARIDKETQIKFQTCRDGYTEFTFARPSQGLTLDASEDGLYNLAKVVNAALADRRAKNEAERMAGA